MRSAEAGSATDAEFVHGLLKKPGKDVLVTSLEELFAEKIYRQK